MKRVGSALTAIGAALMLALIGRAIATASFYDEAGVLLALAWGQVTVADLYLGFLLFSGWVMFREASVGRSVLFVVMILVLGNAFAAAYVAVALWQSRGDWKVFWFGKRTVESVKLQRDGEYPSART